MSSARWVVLAACALALVGLLGCAKSRSLPTPAASQNASAAATGSPASPSAPAADPAAVEMTHKAVVQSGVITVSGRATLPDGSWINWQVGHDPGGEGEPLVYREGAAKVTDGRYGLSTSVARIPYRNVTVWLTFYPGASAQPASVTRLYGPQGEHLSGSHQNWHGDPSDIEYEFDAKKP